VGAGSHRALHDRAAGRQQGHEPALGWAWCSRVSVSHGILSGILCWHPATGSLLVSTPEGAAALTAAIRSLRQGAVEGAHAAHQALRLRAAQLAVEASSHAVGSRGHT
jgi:hypothetical protein